MSDEPGRRTAERERNVIVFGLAIIAAYLLAVFLPDLLPAAAHRSATQLVHGRVISVVQAAALPSDQPSDVPVSSDQPSDVPGPSDQAGVPPGDQGPPGAVEAVVVFLDGPLAGQEGTGIVQGPSGAFQVPDYRPGDDVVVEIDTTPDGTTSFALVDRWRVPLLATLVAILAVSAAVVAGWRGLRAIASLALTLVLVVRLFVPLVVLGWSPVPLAVAFGIAVTILSFTLTQGLTATTLAAIAGTTLGLAVTGVLAAVSTSAAAFTPAQGSDQVIFLQQLTNGSIDLSGLLLAAVIFGGLGVLNDVAISQAATVEELRRADPSLSRWELFSRTMNVGTSHLAATINTLVFAYLGTALPLVVLVVIQSSAAGATISVEEISVEVMRTAVGAIGIVSAVPLTTAFAVAWVGRGGPDGGSRHVLDTPVRD